MIIYLGFDWDKQCCLCGKATDTGKYTDNPWVHDFMESPEKIDSFIICPECYKEIFHGNDDEYWSRTTIKDRLHKITGLEIRTDL